MALNAGMLITRISSHSCAPLAYRLATTLASHLSSRAPLPSLRIACQHIFGCIARRHTAPAIRYPLCALASNAAPTHPARASTRGCVGALRTMAAINTAKTWWQSKNIRHRCVRCAAASGARGHYAATSRRAKPRERRACRIFCIFASRHQRASINRRARRRRSSKNVGHQAQHQSGHHVRALLLT